MQSLIAGPLLFAEYFICFLVFSDLKGSLEVYRSFFFSSIWAPSMF
jgi:hypothetical protein